MDEKQGSFRTTISVSRDLKVRMNKIKEPVNWSALACRAFEDKLAEIAARKERKAMIDVVERLRASLRKEQGMDFDQGYEVAENWAAHSASAAKLERMKAFLDRLNAMAPQERDDWFRVRGNHKPWVELVRIIEGNRNLPVVPYVNEFWRALLGDLFSEASSSKFLRGFVEGAVDLWAKVQPQL